MEHRLDQIIKTAEKILPFFQVRTDDLLKFILDGLHKNNTTVAYNAMACDGCIFMIATPDPKQIILSTIESIKLLNSDKYQAILNPINVANKLDNMEYLVDMGGTRIMYLIKTPTPSNALLKIIACKHIANVYNYDDIMKDDQRNFDELHPDYDYNLQTNRAILGGRKKSNKKSKIVKTNPRIEIIAQMIDLVSNDKDLASHIIFINTQDECRTNAMNIIYTDHKYKDVIIKFMKSFYEHSENYKLKAFMHNDFHVPYDFKLIKHSILLNDVMSGQPTYIANLYNMGTYSIIPCWKEKTINIIMTHPIIKMQLLYIDLYMLEYKSQNPNSDNYKKMYMSRLMDTFYEIQKFSQDVEWYGYYIDDAFEKIRYNKLMKTTDAFTTYFI